MLLVRTRGTTLAALGAAITIFVMAMDPFFQQVARYPQVMVLQTQNSSIPKVIRYEPHFAKVTQDGAEVLNPDLDINAIVDKFFFDHGVPPVKFGNGTRPDIPVSVCKSMIHVRYSSTNIELRISVLLVTAHGSLIRHLAYAATVRTWTRCWILAASTPIWIGFRIRPSSFLMITGRCADGSSTRPATDQCLC